MDGDATPYLFKHAIILIVGIVMIVYLQFFNYKYFSRLSQLGIYVSVLLLLVTLIFGVNKGNASRWIMGFQPSDLAKVVCVIYVARMVVLKKDYIKDFKEGIVPIVWPVILICVLIVPADFSTAALLFVVCFILIFVAGAKLTHLLSIVGGAIVRFCFAN
jgi:cell division protein FtsW